MEKPYKAGQSDALLGRNSRNLFKDWYEASQYTLGYLSGKQYRNDNNITIKGRPTYE